MLTARDETRPVQPERLGALGKGANPAYAITRGFISVGTKEPKADLPIVVEAWALVGDKDKDSFAAFVNRTPITGDVRA